jgi:hypothetical protein
MILVDHSEILFFLFIGIGCALNDRVEGICTILGFEVVGPQARRKYD